MSNNKLTGKSHLISLEEAIEMNNRYRENKDAILDPGTPKSVLCFSETFGREDFDKLLAQNDCVGVRVYYGMHENKDVSAVIVGFNSKNEDIIKTGAGKGDALGGDNIIIENGTRCPVDCPPPSPLNG